MHRAGGAVQRVGRGIRDDEHCRTGHEAHGPGLTPEQLGEADRPEGLEDDHRRRPDEFDGHQSREDPTPAQEAESGTDHRRRLARRREGTPATRPVAVGDWLAQDQGYDGEVDDAEAEAGLAREQQCVLRRQGVPPHEAAGDDRPTAIAEPRALPARARAPPTS